MLFVMSFFDEDIGNIVIAQESVHTKFLHVLNNIASGVFFSMCLLFSFVVVTVDVSKSSRYTALLCYFLSSIF